MKIKKNTVSLSRLAKQEIIKYIKHEKLQPDEQLPSELILMEMMGVSRHTVREALVLLEQEEYIYKIQGKGTFINKLPMKIESGLEKLESISEIIKSFGSKPGGKCLKVVDALPTKQMMEKLKIKQDEIVTTITRIKTADEKVAVFCVDTIPKHFLRQQTPNFMENISMFNLLRDQYNINIEYAVAEIIPTFPTAEMIETLGVNNQELFLLLNQIHYDTMGIPIIYSMDYFSPECFKFKVNRKK